MFRSNTQKEFKFIHQGIVKRLRYLAEEVWGSSMQEKLLETPYRLEQWTATYMPAFQIWQTNREDSTANSIITTCNHMIMVLSEFEEACERLLKIQRRMVRSTCNKKLVDLVMLRQEAYSFALSIWPAEQKLPSLVRKKPVEVEKERARSLKRRAPSAIPVPSRLKVKKPRRKTGNSSNSR